MDIWEGGLDRNVDTGDLVINLAEGEKGERLSATAVDTPHGFPKQSVSRKI